MHGREATSVQSIRKLDSSWRCFIRDGTAGLTSGHTIEPITPIGKVTVRLLRWSAISRSQSAAALHDSPRTAFASIERAPSRRAEMISANGPDAPPDGQIDTGDSMKAFAFTRPLPIEAPDSLVELDLNRPEPRPRDLLVNVRAVSVNQLIPSAGARKHQGFSRRVPAGSARAWWMPRA